MRRSHSESGGSPPERDHHLARGAQLPSSDFIQALGSLLESETEMRTLARRVLDARLEAAEFELVLRRELLELLSWSANKLIRVSRGEPDGMSSASYVLSLLPQAAPATHILRRALPFAALGIPTRCVFRREVRARGTQAVRELAEALALGDVLTAEQARSDIAVAMAPPSALIVVTGRRATAQAVRSLARARVIGATGRCAVVLAATPAKARRLVDVLGSGLPNSCTQARAGFASVSDTEAIGLGTRPGVYRLEDIVRRLHPSAVLEEAGTREDVERDIAGYQVFSCSPDGSTATSTGFAADPVFGWPGDYRF